MTTASAVASAVVAGKVQRRTRLAEWREKRGVTQEELAVATGISTSTIRRLENPADLLRANPPLRYLQNCALALGCKLSQLIEPEWQEWLAFDQRKPRPPKADGFWRSSPGRSRR
jgi:transcriptional regulator with XRE-family HTH domain